MTARFRTLPTPTGPFAIIEEASGRCRTAWLDAEPGHDVPAEAVEDARLRPGLARQLARALAGAPEAFADVPTPEGPPFHRACWEACRRIPLGRTASYAELAAAAGRPGAARAAGQAMRLNPMPIVVPCHRVVASDGSLGGYSGHRDDDSTALVRKRWLLGLEGALESADPKPVNRAGAPA